MQIQPLLSNSEVGSSLDELESAIDAEQRAYQQELTEHRLLQDAMSGNNLLGMMIEDKPKFGRQVDDSSSTLEASYIGGENQGQQWQTKGVCLKSAAKIQIWEAGQLLLNLE